MPLAFVPPRWVTIGDAASFVGTTPQVIRRYHELGLLPEPKHGNDDRRYRYDELVRLLWIAAMTDAGIAESDLPDTPAGPGLLSEVVSSRLDGLLEGSVRQADLDTLLVTERIFGPLGAAVQATRFIAMATHPDLREASDRVEATEEALDDTVAVNDPRVAQVAAERHAFELALHAVIEDSGLARSDDELFDSWEIEHPATTDDEAEKGSGGALDVMSAVEAAGKMPYDFSPARLRCMELAEELAAQDLAARESTAS